ncbi:Retinol dehydrogenase 11 [Cryptotermes secundus]|uniref:Retinol dehydrogenase 11 n=1 Tax=Cryptotermes secundus TaxID=105785 RepID=A0A2J7PGU9_9NEOP|nr:retinol dehydrogenase 11 [Cryptotermes secundus]XP_023725020.1 retinol dehydrogenase 11 [Cryptotermes secundus]XP_023725021.1 retinol dehydrogenase 11 [Cryptotermes secundus]XP_023725022.1 retinol dehydrogenase 11 [Cryptotermes secundus]XP_023725023.1 retinol dehydrogenase 11 [Cryptotermes secundus]XP_023725024.1 retinol dehydrogenase 11 [Cryptotermes secundus]XP_023725025.1 retinol dehydrogenase 11 [Cryptotermes secundus]XP_023725026.1 retinol dehydrogenase 11 [Cryptotermes secundus]XP_
MSCGFNCPLVWGILVFLIGFKLYVKLTTGVCRSKKRLDGKTVIVTGANTGIGKETARDLAQRGAKVILGCRDLEKGKKACDEIIASTGNAKVEVQHLDLSSLASVRKFANNIIDTEPHLDVLINNAGATRVEQKLTDDGLLLGMQVNHFGHFLLTCLLVDLLKRSSPSRIVIVASELHRLGSLDLDDFNSVNVYGSDRIYCNSKLANVLMSNELARKLKGTGVTVNSLHPGVILSDFFRNFGPIVGPIVKFFLLLFCKDVHEGAQTSIFLAVSEDVEGVSGKYFTDCKDASASKSALDEGLAKKLWEKSEALVGLSPEEADF